jgi:hypothetical protein
MSYRFDPRAERYTMFESLIRVPEDTGEWMAFSRDLIDMGNGVLLASVYAAATPGGRRAMLLKSADGGATWSQLAGGLPTTADGLGRLGIGISPSNPRRIYVTATAGAKSGLYRSDDAGATWTRTTTDSRIFGRGDDFAAVTVDPRDPNTLYSMNVVAWKSTDAGVTWTAFRGAPGGDDYQRLWINPLVPTTMLLVADQGAVITVNDGETWSSWYNQGTAQFYHVTADNAWPYRVCGGQQESGSACVAKIRSASPSPSVSIATAYAAASRDDKSAKAASRARSSRALATRALIVPS